MQRPAALSAIRFGATLLCLALAACAGQSAPGRDAELERETGALRARVERLESESATERARLAADIAAMREDMRALRAALEEASRNLATLSGQEGVARPAQPGKGPRQALRDSLRGVLEVSREALERLNQELDKQLAQPQKPDKPAPDKIER